MTNLSYDFSGAGVIVTGAAQGVGLAIATKFAQASAAAYLVDADEAELTAAAKRIGGIPVCADVTDSARVNHVVETVIENYGRLDVVVNNAGILRDQVVGKMTDDDWRRVLDVQLGEPFDSPGQRSSTSDTQAAGGGRRAAGGSST
jgi:3-oxoacyl-[acyl-carrier protein] reductase